MTMKRPMSFRDRVYRVVARIPRGTALTYGEVAKRAGSPRAARAVGSAMKHNTNPKHIPCHRVVCADGTVGDYAFGGPRAKAKKLRTEGVLFVSKERVQLSK